MKSIESSSQQAASTRSYAAPTPNPFIIVSDRSSRLTLIVLVSCALTVAALTRLFLVLTGCDLAQPDHRRRDRHPNRN